jgi:hypothetical protein
MPVSIDQLPKQAGGGEKYVLSPEEKEAIRAQYFKEQGLPVPPS